MNRIIVQLIVPFILGVSGAGFSQDAAILWTRSDSSTQGCTVIDFKTDQEGNVFTLGRTYGETRMKMQSGNVEIIGTKSERPPSYFLQKLNAKGELIWANDLSIERNLIGGLIVPDEKGGVVLCSSEKGEIGKNDYFLESFSKDGNGTKRKKIIENHAEYYDCAIYDLLIDGDGSFHFVGNLRGTTLFLGHKDTIGERYSNDAFYLKVNTNFDYDFLKVFGGSGSQKLVEIAVNNKNEIFIGGNFQLKKQEFSEESIDLNYTHSEVVIGKYNQEGKKINWVSYPANYLASINGLEVNSSQNLVTVITMRGMIELGSSAEAKSNIDLPNYGMYIATINSNLKLQTVEQFASDQSFKTERLFIDQQDQIYLIGQYPKGEDFDPGKSIVITDEVISNKYNQRLIAQKRNEKGEFLSFHYLPEMNGGSFYLVNVKGNLLSASNFVHKKGGNQFTYGIVTSERGNYFATKDSIIVRSCENYYWDKTKKTYTESGIYSAGENAEYQLNLTIEKMDLSIVVNDQSIIANAKDATFRWLDVDHNYRPLKYETDSILNFRESGTYCVEVTSKFCKTVDTSEAVTVVKDGVHIEDLKKYYTADYSKTIILKINREHIQLNPDEVKMIPFRDGPLYGFVKNGKKDKWLIKPRFEQVFAVYNEGAIVKDTTKFYYKGRVYPKLAYGLVNPKGKYLIPPHYTNLFNENGIYHGIRHVYEDTTLNLPEEYRGYYAHDYYDKKGKLLFSIGAHELKSFGTEDYAWFRFGKKYMIYNRSGELVKEFDLDEYRPFIGIADNKLLFNDEETGLTAYGMNGEVAFNFPKQSSLNVYQLSENNFGVMGYDGDYYFCDSLGQGKKYGINSGSIGMIQSYDAFFKTDNFVVRDYNTSLYGVVDREGDTKIDFKYQYIGTEVNGYRYCIDSNHRRVFVADNGYEIEELLNNNSFMTSTLGDKRFSLVQVHGFHDGLAIGSGRHPLPDSLANKPFPWTQADKNVFEAYNNEHYFYYDTTGTIVLTLPDSIALAGNFSDGLAPALTNDKLLGFIDKNGNWAIQPKYELAVAGAYPLPYIVVPYFENGFAYIKSFKGYIDEQGNEYFSGERMQDKYNFSH